ncbi:MAG: hypothetical protein PHY55_00185 [Bacteroidales bacterium]|jgi:hypothetical protein|nr:hypothetical protein [Bacteroidales bacterium]
MARKQLSLIEDVRTPEEKLSDLLPVYEANKSEMDSYKKLVDRDNKEIKSIMLGAEMGEFVVDDIKASCSVSVREDFVEEALIAKLKEMKIRGVVKKKEYVDMDALENAIYNGKVDAASLADCQTKKEVVTLRVSKLKRKEG